ncbi:hypothetical protein K439DRAFT_196686 [Ramaria rubella]|nr:hypothetical protein K439DRAFT_196686 [Ramaria rubella]
MTGLPTLSRPIRLFSVLQHIGHAGRDIHTPPPPDIPAVPSDFTRSSVGNQTRSGSLKFYRCQYPYFVHSGPILLTIIARQPSPAKQLPRLIPQRTSVGTTNTPNTNACIPVRSPQTQTQTHPQPQTPTSQNHTPNAIHDTCTPTPRYIRCSVRFY